MAEEPAGKEPGVTIDDIAERLGISRQRAHRLAQTRGWEPVRQGRQAPGAKTLYRLEDVAEELRRRMRGAEKDASSARRMLERVEAELAAGAGQPAAEGEPQG